MNLINQKIPYPETSLNSFSVLHSGIVRLRTNPGGNTLIKRIWKQENISMFFLFFEDVFYFLSYLFDKAMLLIIF